MEEAACSCWWKKDAMCCKEQRAMGERGSTAYGRGKNVGSRWVGAAVLGQPQQQLQHWAKICVGVHQLES